MTKVSEPIGFGGEEQAKIWKRLLTLECGHQTYSAKGYSPNHRRNLPKIGFCFECLKDDKSYE